MADYDLFVLNAEGEIIRSTRIVSDSDVEVVAIAKKQAVGVEETLEVWEGARSVARLPAPNSAASDADTAS